MEARGLRVAIGLVVLPILWSGMAGVACSPREEARRDVGGDAVAGSGAAGSGSGDAVSAASDAGGQAGGGASADAGGGGTSGGAGQPGPGGTAGGAGAPPDDGGPSDARMGDGARDAESEATDAGGLYRPCPASGPCVIMPLGDSITFGYKSTTGGGYRLRLLHDIWAARHDATFVGNSVSGPDQLEGKPFPKKNEGHSAYTIDAAPSVMRDGIAPLVPASLEKYQPHIVTLMIGTNDLGTNNDVGRAPGRLAALIDTITTTSPEALLVVAQITPTGDDRLNTLTRMFNATIPALVAARVAAGKHILLVDMYAAFTAHAAYRTDYMSDSLHPNDVGYDLMGDVWYAALASHL